MPPVMDPAPTTPTPRRQRLRAARLLAAARRDLLLLVLVAATTLIVAHRLDLFEHLWGWSRRWEWFEADELLVTVLVTACALVAIVWRRWRDFGRTLDAYQRALAELRDSEARFRAIFEHAAIGIGLADLERRPLLINPALARFTGRDGGEAGAGPFPRSTHPEDAARDAALFAELVAGTRDHYQLEKRYISADGQLAWGRLTTSLVRDASGVPQYAIGMVEDITGRMLAEAALREREARYRAVVEQAAEGIFLFNADTRRIVEANPACCRLLGYAEAELVALTLYDVVAHDRASIDANIARIGATGHHPVGEREYRREDGSLVTVEVSATALATNEAQLLCVVVRDSTARLAAEATLRASEAKLQAVVQNAPVLLFTLDGAGVTTFAAGRVLAALGHTPAGVVGWSPFAAAPRDPAVPGYVRRALAGETVTARVAAGEFVFATHYAPLRDAAGAVSGVIGVATDVTALAQAEAARNEAHRQLAASREEEQLRLARELHDGPVQQLAGARYQLAASRRRAAAGRPAPELIPAMQQGEAQLAAVIGQLRGIIGELRPAGLDEQGLPVALENYAATIGRTGTGARRPMIALDLDPAGATLSPIVALGLFRVAQEALRNALAHANAGRVVVRLRLRARAATLSIADDGRGFAPPADLRALARDGHFGLLGMAERIAQVEGHLRLRSRPGRGTVVTARVPLRGETVDGDDDPGGAGR